MISVLSAFYTEQGEPFGSPTIMEELLWVAVAILQVHLLTIQ